MSDTSGEEKTLQPTEKKLKDAREKGQIAQYRDMLSVLSAMTAMGLLWTGLDGLADQAVQLFDGAARATAMPFDQALSGFGKDAVLTVLAMSLPIMLTVAAVGVAAAILLNRGLLFSVERIAPNVQHINPAEGAGRLFAMRNLIEIAKAIVRSILLSVLAGALLYEVVGPALRAPACGGACVAESLIGGFAMLASVLLLAMFAIAVLDMRLQSWLHLRDLRMSHSEVKRENKQMEGDPLLRGQRRRLAKEAAEAGPTGVRAATLAVVGKRGRPVVGLRFVAGTTPVPVIVCVAKQRPQASAMRAALANAGVPIVSRPDLAQMLSRGRIGQYVPEDSYEEVAVAMHMAGQI